MTIYVEATYANGMLKPARPLPLQEDETVQVAVRRSADIQGALEAVERSYGLLSLKGDPETLERIANDDEFGILESP